MISVAVILPTSDRHLLTGRALHYYTRSTIRAYTKCVLVVVDAGRRPLDLARFGDGVRYIRATPGTSIGTMRNIGIESVTADFVFDLDSDDWYSRDWFSKSLWEMVGADPVRAKSGALFTGCSCHSMYDIVRKRAWPAQVNTRQHLASGATFGFRRELWWESPFPDSSDGEDHEFLLGLERLTGFRLIAVDGAEDFVYVRHPGNVTGHFAEGRIDVDLTSKVRGYMDPDDLRWYDSIAEICNGGDVEIRRPDWHLPTSARAGRR